MHLLSNNIWSFYFVENFWEFPLFAVGIPNIMCFKLSLDFMRNAITIDCDLEEIGI